MSFEEKSINMTPCHIVPSEITDWPAIVEKIINKPVPDEVAVSAEAVWGWSAGATPLMKPTTDNIYIDSDILHFRYTCLERKVPASTKAAHVDMRIRERKKQTGMQYLSSDEKKDIREDVIDYLQMDIPPSIVSIEIIHRIGSNTIYIGSNSANGVDSVLELLMTNAGFPSMYRMSSSARVTVLTRGDLSPIAMSPMQFTERVEDQVEPGRDFMTWLWYATAGAEGGKFEIQDYGELIVAISSPIQMERDKEEVLLKGALAAASKGAMYALKSGYKPLKYKLSFVCNKQVWEFSLDSLTMAYSGLKLPTENEPDSREKFRERINNMDIVDAFLGNLYYAYLMQVDTDEKANELMREIRAWISEADLDQYA